MKWIKNKIVLTILTAALSGGLAAASLNPQWSKPIMAFVTSLASNYLEEVPEVPAQPEQK